MPPVGLPEVEVLRPDRRGAVAGDAPSSTRIPGRPRRKDRLSLRAILLTVAPILLGVALADWAMPRLFPLLRHDGARTRTLLSVLRDPRLSPEMVIYGNSVVMNGIDACQLGRELAERAASPGGGCDEGRILNLSSSDQKLAEAFLTYQELPPSVRTIVQFVWPEELETAPFVQPNIYNTFYMYGYRPTPETVAGLTDVFGPTARRLLERSARWHHFQARWVLRSAFDTSLRILLRPDLAHDRSITDLFYPYQFAERAKVSSGALETLFHDFRGARPREGLHASPVALHLLEQMQGFAARTDRRLVLVFMPLHPGMREYYGPAFVRDLERFPRLQPAEDGVAPLSAATVLEADHFVDRLHPTDEGARVFTRWLAGQIGEGR